MSGFAYGCCVGSWDRFTRYAVPGNFIRDRESRLVFATSGQSGIVAAYNGIIHAVHDRDVDGLILVHDDLEIRDPDAEDKFREVFTDPNVALAGVAGATDVHSLAWWEGTTVGHQDIDTGPIDFGQREGDVTTLEGSIIVMSPWAVRNMLFDPRFTGFHGYDCDIAMTAARWGKRVAVVDVDTHHHVKLGFKSDASAEAWRLADSWFRSKWNL